ncbi:MAG TPA: hypothetical protein VGL58_19540 [Caulobacteraceae bacterium]|jgi:N-acetylglutamate synthase-like GNAT family acetyltransferase
MRHARPQDLDRIEPLLEQIRAFGVLKEKKRGVFYVKSQSFLHFHEDPKGMFADVGLGRGFDRFKVDEPEGAQALLDRVAALRV